MRPRASSCPESRATTELALGLSLGLGAGLAPGPLLALVVRSTLRGGFSAGARTATAPLISDAPIVVACVLVLRELPEQALAALSLAGALFVAWLAWDALHADSSSGGSTDLRRAVLVNALSPHPWLFWLAVGGPLLVEAGHRSAVLAVAFAAGFYITLVGAKVAVAGLLDAARRRGGARLLPRALAEPLAASRAVRRFAPAAIVSAVLLAAAAIVLAADAVTRLR